MFDRFHRPTFKTATSTSRTQLKQQLQREQLQELERQELERRENERKLSMQGHGSNTSIDHSSQMAHSSHSSPQLQVPRLGAGIPQMYTSSPTPSTSTEGSDFASGHYSNHSQQPNASVNPNTSANTNLTANPMPPQTDLSTAQLKVPLHIGVDLPPQVLKVNVPEIAIINYKSVHEKVIKYCLQLFSSAMKWNGKSVEWHVFCLCREVNERWYEELTVD